MTQAEADLYDRLIAAAAAAGALETSDEAQAGEADAFFDDLMARQRRARRRPRGRA